MREQSRTAGVIAETGPCNGSEVTIKYRQLTPYTAGEINVLLLENISTNAVKIFQQAGFNVKRFSLAFLMVFTGGFNRWKCARRRFLKTSCGPN